jgi:LmbE family N-acetylglucosaminyl deacetylase
MNVLAVGCHPDDLEIGCGGTLAKYAKLGHKVVMCHIASGSMGHVVIEPEELVLIREKEAQAAADMIGAESISLNVNDIEVESSSQKVLRELILVVKETKPDLIITHNPDDYMRDHIETSKLAFNASFASSLPHMVRQAERHEKIVPIFYMDTLAGIGFIPTEYVDISDYIEQKLNALNCHESQIKWMKDHDNIDFLDFVRTCSKYRGLQASVPYAEGFRQYAGWPRFTTQRLLP